MTTQTHFDEVDHPRGPHGKFTTKPSSEADIELDDDTSTPESLLGEATVRPNRWGQVVTVQGPVLYLGASVPEEHADDPEYLGRRWHRLEAFAAEEYGAVISNTTDDGSVEAVQLSWDVTFEDATPEEADDLVVKAREHLLKDDSGLHELHDALEEGAYERTRFSEDLEEYLVRTDEEAKQPRDLVLDPDRAGVSYPADLDQESLDHAVQTAREHIEIAHRVRRPEARNGSFIAIDDGGRVSVYDANAWTPPTSQPMLPWRAPNAVPFAKVDMDGHASLLSTEETPCQDCGLPLEDKASPNMRRHCMSCTGEWEDDA